MNQPRVSTILALLYPDSLDFVQPHHLDRGTALHLEMEVWVNNILLAFPQSVRPLPPECERVAEWLVKEKVVFHGAEELIEHKLGFVGHPDLLGQWVDDYVFDYKFAEALTEQNEMQMEVYTRITRRKGCFLQCPKEGPVVAKRHRPNAGLWNAFLAGLHVWKFRAARRPPQLSETELQHQLTDIKEKLACHMEN